MWCGVCAARDRLVSSMNAWPCDRFFDFFFSSIQHSHIVANPPKAEGMPTPKPTPSAILSDGDNPPPLSLAVVAAGSSD